MCLSYPYFYGKMKISIKGGFISGISYQIDGLFGFMPHKG